jgi:hypothetical protein
MHEPIVTDNPGPFAFFALGLLFLFGCIFFMGGIAEGSIIGLIGGPALWALAIFHFIRWFRAAQRDEANKK